MRQSPSAVGYGPIWLQYYRLVHVGNSQLGLSQIDVGGAPVIVSLYRLFQLSATL